MKILTTVGLSLAIAIFLTSCSFDVKVNEQNETDMGSHHVVVKPGSTFTNSWSSEDSEEYHYSSGDISVTIRNEELVVNRVKYGKLNSGDPISIDNGKVLVANQKRDGVPMSDEEILSSASVKESTAELAGYNVTVRPGSSFTATTFILSKHTLTVGETKISIDKDELFVNGESYGQVKMGDIILVENLKVLKVSVSGKAREPKE